MELPYIKVHDALADHPKIAALHDDSAGFLLVALWGYCHRMDTDGRVPKAVAHRLTTSASPARCRKLVAHALLEDAGTDYVCHDYLDHQQSSEERASARERNRSNGQAGGLARARRAAKQVASKPPSKGSSQIQAEVEIEVEQQTSSVVTRKRATPPPDLFPITDAMAAWGREHCPNVHDPARQTEQFLDHHRARGSTFKDWTAAWRTWMTNAQRYAIRDGVEPVRAADDPSKAYLRESS